jgi:hypothetical protein
MTIPQQILAWIAVAAIAAFVARTFMSQTARWVPIRIRIPKPRKLRKQ